MPTYVGNFASAIPPFLFFEHIQQGVAQQAGRSRGCSTMEEAGLQLPDFEESDFYVEQEQVSCTA